MIEDPVVVLAATTRGWSSRLRAHAADHGGVRIRATVLRPEDALAEQSAVVLVDDITSFLTPAFVAALQAQDRAVLGLYDAGDSQGKSDLVDAGVDTMAPADIEAEELLDQIRALASRQPQDRTASRRPPRAAEAPAGCRTIGVVGPTGGTGITEIALELAACLAAADIPTALVDFDELSPVLAQRLDLPLHPNVHTAVRAVENAQPLTALLHPIATRRPLRVLPGMAVAEDWQTVPATAGAKLLGALATDHRAAVLDLGHALPRVEGPTGHRFGHAAAMAARCDDLLVVAAPTPTAVSRTIAMVARVRTGPRRVHLVLNHVGKDAYVRDEAVAELRRATGASRVHLISADPAVPRAGWQGSRVVRGRFRRGVGELARAVGLVPA